MTDTQDAENHLLYLKGYTEGKSYQKSDQAKGVQTPAYEKPVFDGQQIIKLPDPATVKLKNPNIFDCINSRKSNRNFTKDQISIEELSFLLWATQGVHNAAGDERHKHRSVKRTVPSAGARHPFEAYVAVTGVEGLDEGIYRYIGSSNSLVLENTPDDLKVKLTEGAIGQNFCGAAPAFFLWSIIPYRTTWRYVLPVSVKLMSIDAGHIGQNLHLACEALGLGTCMIGAYNQNLMDKLFGFNGNEEFAFYMAPVGRPA